MSETGLLEVAVVTGGASGACCCRELARRGATVAVLDRDGAAAATIAHACGGRAWTANVADETGMKPGAAAIEAERGAVGIRVNCAGILQTPLPPERVPMATCDGVVSLDQRGTYVANVTLGQRKAERRRGSTVSTASVVGMRAMLLHAYAAAKGAVIAITECLAAEWGPAQVRVNAVSPGYTRTPPLQAAIDKGERDVSALAGNAALGRLVEPDEVARVVAFLAGPVASGSLASTCRSIAAGFWLHPGTPMDG